MSPSRDLDFLNDLPPAEKPELWEYEAGRVLAWNEYGDPRGIPVMYYHGWPSSRLQARLSHHLARDLGIRVIAMDRPGMGKSTFVPGRTLAEWPALMGRFADSLGIGKFGQLAISGGGPYALACAACIPGRITGSAVLAGAVLVGDGGVDRGGLHPFYRLLIPLRHSMPALFFRAVFGTASLVCGLKPSYPPLSWTLATMAAEDRRVLLDFPDLWEVLTCSFREGVDENPGHGVMTDAEIYFLPSGFGRADVTRPIRYWHGGQDRNISIGMVREFTRDIPGVELIVEEELGHFSLAILRARAAMEYLAEKSLQSGD